MAAVDWSAWLDDFNRELLERLDLDEQAQRAMDTDRGSSGERVPAPPPAVWGLLRDAIRGRRI